jgi:hypothetical protein
VGVNKELLEGANAPNDRDGGSDAGGGKSGLERKTFARHGLKLPQ